MRRRNAALGVVAAVADHPLPELVRAGVACSLNADDTLVFGTDLAREYQLAGGTLGFTDEGLADLARTSIGNSAAPDAIARPALTGVDTWLDRDR